ncbi:hypothetical protein M8C21_013854, partial [Ambrosia artemisiifolia]
EGLPENFHPSPISSSKSEDEMRQRKPHKGFEAAWRAGNWDFSVLYMGSYSPNPSQQIRHNHFNQKLHSCLRAFQEGDNNEFKLNLKESKQV